MKCAKRVVVVLGVGVAGWMLASLTVQAFLMFARIANDNLEDSGYR